MGLSPNEQVVLDRIENELAAADPELTGAFAAFWDVTWYTHLPLTEQMAEQDARTATSECGRTGRPGLAFALRLVLIFLIGALLAAGVVIACSGAGRAKCAMQALATNAKVDLLGMHANVQALQQCVGNVPGWGNGAHLPMHVRPGGQGLRRRQAELPAEAAGQLTHDGT